MTLTIILLIVCIIMIIFHLRNVKKRLYMPIAFNMFLDATCGKFTPKCKLAIVCNIFVLFIDCVGWAIPQFLVPVACKDLPYGLRALTIFAALVLSLYTAVAVFMTKMIDNKWKAGREIRVVVSSIAAIAAYLAIAFVILNGGLL